MARERRHWEIDAVRGAAVISMIAFHFAFDLSYFSSLPINVDSGFWLLLARLTAATFLLLVGLSLTLSYSRVRGRSGKMIWLKYIRRGIKIFSYGMLITLATWLLVPEGTILFGVLHLIGLSIILSRPFLDRKRLSLAAGLVIILSGLWLQGMRFPFPWLLWLGLPPYSFYTFDYFPLFPWFGLVLVGIFLGNTLYPSGRRKFSFAMRRPRPFSPLCFLGRNSLIIYFLHQPLLIATLLLLGLL